MSWMLNLKKIKINMSGRRSHSAGIIPDGQYSTVCSEHSTSTVGLLQTLPWFHAVSYLVRRFFSYLTCTGTVSTLHPYIHSIHPFIHPLLSLPFFFPSQSYFPSWLALHHLATAGFLFFCPRPFLPLPPSPSPSPSSPFPSLPSLSILPSFSLCLRFS